MDKHEIKKTATRFRSQYTKGQLTLDGIKEVLRDQGYTIVEFNHIFNDEDVATVIDELHLSSMTDKSKGFTYVDRNHRLVFLHEDLSKEEKLLVLAHEEGHIFCEHFHHSPIIGVDVEEEYEANEFAHYILNPPAASKAGELIKRHKRITIAVAIALVFCLIGGIGWSHVAKERTYYGEYYVTSSGNKYHEKDCIFVKNKTDVRRLTEEEFESGEYEACQVCLP